MAFFQGMIGMSNNKYQFAHRTLGPRRQKREFNQVVGRCCMLITVSAGVFPNGPEESEARVEIEEVEMEPDELKNERQEVKIRNGRVVSLEKGEGSLELPELSVVVALLDFMKVKLQQRIVHAQVEFEFTAIQVRKQIDSTTCGNERKPEDVFLRVITELSIRVVLGTTGRPPDELGVGNGDWDVTEKDRYELITAIRNCYISLPRKVDGSDRGDWWDWISDERKKSVTKPPTKSTHLIECRSYDNRDLPDCRVTVVQEDELRELVVQESPTFNRLAPKAGLKLIHSRQVEDSQPFEKDTWAALNEGFHLPHVCKHFISRRSGFVGRVSGANGEHVFICKSAENTAAITAVLSFNTGSSMTTGYIISGIGQYILPSLLSEFPLQYATYTHPITIFILVLELIAAKISVELEDVDTELREVEGQTGYSHRFQPERKDSPEKDFRQLAKALGAESCRFVVIRSAIANAIMLKDFIVEQLKCDDEYMPVEDKIKGSGVVRKALLERVSVAASTLRHMDTEAGIEGRLQAQQNVLFNLIAQEDNALNVSIARDSKELAVASKQDSSAMRVIAVLTTIFLPGAFISSFFAMPLFDWSATPSSRIITSHFWVYWATTIPLTLLVMLFVSAWIVFQGRRNEKLSREAREAVGGSELSNTDGDASSSNSESVFVDDRTGKGRVKRWLVSLGIGFMKLMGRHEVVVVDDWRSV